MTHFTPGDIHFMQLALRLAQRGLGITTPNPSVGCVLVKNNVVVGRGWTAAGGRPHAEVIALDHARDKAEGATAYVTLEPCAHEGVTQPCAKALINAKVKRVVIGVTDPDSRVFGKGMAMLENAGIEVTHGCLEEEAAESNKGFFLNKNEGRPMVSLKLAQSLDGKISMSNSTQTWLTSEIAKDYAHLLRYRHDAILIGTNTLKADNPLLSCRLPGLDIYSPMRVILDRELIIKDDSAILETAFLYDTVIFTSNESVTSERVEAIESLGASVVGLDQNRESLDINQLLSTLAQMGITRLLVEGGARTIHSFLKERLVDKVYSFTAPIELGDEAYPKEAIRLVDPEDPSWKLERSTTLGDDTLDVYTKVELDQNESA